MNIMESQLMQYAPTTWDKNGRDRNLVRRYTPEYEELEAIFSKRNCRVNRIERYENVYRYAQFLVRQQHCMALAPGRKYYTARKFAHVSSSDIARAIEHQMDHRYLPQLDSTFRNDIGNPSGNEVFVISVVTANFDSPFQPERDSDFYVEYIVYLD